MTAFNKIKLKDKDIAKEWTVISEYEVQESLTLQI